VGMGKRQRGVELGMRVRGRSWIKVLKDVRVSGCVGPYGGWSSAGGAISSNAGKGIRSRKEKMCYSSKSKGGTRNIGRLERAVGKGGEKRASLLIGL